MHFRVHSVCSLLVLLVLDLFCCADAELLQIDDTDSFLTFNGNWTRVEDPNGFSWGGGYMMTDDPDASVNFGGMFQRAWLYSPSWPYTVSVEVSSSYTLTHKSGGFRKEELIWVDSDAQGTEDTSIFPTKPSKPQPFRVPMTDASFTLRMGKLGKRAVVDMIELEEIVDASARTLSSPTAVIAPKTTTSNPVASPSPSPNSTPAPDPSTPILTTNPPDPKSPLSKGNMVGVAVGVGASLFIVLACFGVWKFCYQKKNTRKRYTVFEPEDFVSPPERAFISPLLPSTVEAHTNNPFEVEDDTADTGTTLGLGGDKPSYPDPFMDTLPSAHDVREDSSHSVVVGSPALRSMPSRTSSRQIPGRASKEKREPQRVYTIGNGPTTDPPCYDAVIQSHGGSGCTT